MPELKICFINFGTINGPSFSRSYLLAQNLADLGQEVTLITTSDTSRFRLYKKKSDKLTIIEFPYLISKRFAQGGFSIVVSIMKAVFLLKNKFDIVQTDSVHRLSCWIPAFFASNFSQSLHVAEWWDNYGKGGHFDRKRGIKKITLGNYDRLTEKIARKQANAIIALSNITIERAQRIGFTRDKILLLHGGADIKYLKYNSNFRFRENFGLNNYEFVFGLVGMNSDEILDILPLINAIKEIDNKYNICVFTTGRKLSNEQKLDLKLNKNFIEFGWIDYNEFSDLLSCASAFALLQRDDLQSRSRWPNKAGDYLAIGRPIIINAVGEVASFKEKDLPFLFWTNGSLSNLKDIIVELISKNYDELLQIGAEARSFAENEVSWKSKAQNLLGFYKNLLTIYSRKNLNDEEK